MIKSRVSGSVAVSRLLKQLPQSVRDEMAEVLRDYGVKLLAAMRRDVPNDTGELHSRLLARLVRSNLRLRVGFLGKRANGPKRIASRKVTTTVNGRRRKINDQFVGSQFYGRFVEFGRKAQTVNVTRRMKRGGRAYTMRVPAMDARPFVYKKRPELRSQLSKRLGTLWTNALADAARGAGND